jgi:hypothetical protein
MWIDWTKKVFHFRHEGKRITVKGIKDNVAECAEITVDQLHLMIEDCELVQLVELNTVQSEETQSGIAVEIRQVLQTYEDCFAEPQSLPPDRAYNHRIPLLPGVKPVFVKPYRYSPQ